MGDRCENVKRPGEFLTYDNSTGVGQQTLDLLHKNFEEIFPLQSQCLTREFWWQAETIPKLV